MSSWFLTVINFDRLYFFKYPLRYILLTKKYPTAVGAFVVTSSVGSVSALWLSRSVSVTDTCATAFTDGGRYAYVTFIAATCALPIVSSFVLSSYLYVLTSRRSTKRKINSLLFIATMSVWTLLSLLPSRLFLSWFFLVHDRRSCPGDVFYWLAWTSNLLMRLCPAVNAVITGLICAPYRRELIQIIAEVKSVVNRVFFHVEHM
ncbi:Protein AEXR-1 [Aphelenchoides avenae]|nr:Protein AEXR-1 [Aphelenchus avenae]